MNEYIHNIKQLNQINLIDEIGIKKKNKIRYIIRYKQSSEDTEDSEDIFNPIYRQMMDEGLV